MRQTIESAWAETFLGKPQLDHDRDQDVDACLRWFQDQLKPAAVTDSSSTMMTTVTTTNVTTGPADPSASSLSPLAGEESVDEAPLDENAKLTERARFAFIQASGYDIDWADSLRFSELSFSAQRVALFLRAIIAKPDLVILDEAFSGMDDYTRDRCMLFLERGQEKTWAWDTFRKKLMKLRINRLADVARYKARVTGLEERQALISVSHLKEEVPDVVKEWMCLRDAQTPPAVGKIKTSLKLKDGKWDSIWGVRKTRKRWEKKAKKLSKE